MYIFDFYICVLFTVQKFKNHSKMAFLSLAGIYGGQSASIPINFMPNWGIICPTNFTLPLFPTSTKKKVIPEKHDFPPPKNKFFARKMHAFDVPSAKQLF